jgi:hypothetical protein
VARPVTGAPRWGVSSLDWQSHAINEDAEHPYGVRRCRLHTAGDPRDR